MYLKKRLKLFTCCSLAIAITTAMVGCGQQANAPGPSSSDPSPAVQTTPEAKTFKPEEPINVIVPFSPGGSSDLVARNVEKVWSKYCDQPIFIVNKAGGGGVDGATFVSRSKPDGYTLIMGYGSGHDTVMPQLEKLNYDPFTDLVPVSRLSIHSVLVLVKGDSEINSIKDVVDLAKKTNQPITAAVSTTAGSVDMVMRGIGVATGINITPVPHAGGSQAITTLIGGHTIIGGGHPTEVISQLKDKRLKAIGVALKERDKTMPDVPTLMEQGVDFYTWGSVKGVAAPPNTPKEIIEYYEDLFKKICEDPDFIKSMTDMLQPVNYQNAEDFGKFMREMYDDYGELIDKLGLAKK